MSSLLAKYFYLSHDSAEAVVTSTLKSYFMSVRLIKDTDEETPTRPSSETNVLIGRTADKENRNIYLIYHDTHYNRNWIFEINISTRVVSVVLMGENNLLGLHPDYKAYNPIVVNGKLIFTDNLNPMYQIDIERAKRSFFFGIGYAPHFDTEIWVDWKPYQEGKIVSHGKYFYRSINDSTGEDPTDQSMYWERLCPVLDAYYSLKVENFYFAPKPPDKAPIVAYKTDDLRRINNLRQALFQFAYNYIYMDYRESTYSPASIVRMPQAEEDIASGLTTGEVSLNNALQIEVDTGGEEVRKIRIIGRSSVDPASWFVVEEIDKFGYGETPKGVVGVTSHLGEVPKEELKMRTNKPSIVNIIRREMARNNLSIIAMKPTITNYFVVSSARNVGWEHDQFGPSAARTASVNVAPGNAILDSFPAWMIVADSFGTPLNVNDSISNDSLINIYPANANTGETRSEDIVLRNTEGNIYSINVLQTKEPAGAFGPVTSALFAASNDPNGMTLSHGSTQITANAGIRSVAIAFKPIIPDYGLGVPFRMYWRALVNDVYRGSGGNFMAFHGNDNSQSIILLHAPAEGDSIIVYLRSEPF